MYVPMYMPMYVPMYVPGHLENANVFSPLYYTSITSIVLEEVYLGMFLHQEFFVMV